MLCYFYLMAKVNAITMVFASGLGNYFDLSI